MAAILLPTCSSGNGGELIKDRLGTCAVAPRKTPLISTGPHYRMTSLQHWREREKKENNQKRKIQIEREREKKKQSQSCLHDWQRPLDTALLGLVNYDKGGVEKKDKMKIMQIPSYPNRAPTTIGELSSCLHSFWSERGGVLQVGTTPDLSSQLHLQPSRLRSMQSFPRCS